MKNKIRIGGVFEVVCRDKGGNIKWEEKTRNLIVNQGLNHMLDVLMHGTTQVSPWYMGLKGAGVPAASDTLSSHASWSEISAYSGNRQEYVEAAASSQQISNSANKASFSINADSTAVAGAFLASTTDNSGILLCAANFSTTKNCDNGDTLEVTYTLSAADDGA